MRMAPPPDSSEFIVRGETRFDLWQRIIAARKVRTIVEIGVWKGEFAEHIFSGCPDIETYYLLDPWRHVDTWNKPANVRADTFDVYYDQVMKRTEPWKDKRKVLRGLTTEVVDQIPDGSVDFAYLDGDHSLKGITIDLVKIWPKVADGGMIGGDDFTVRVWQHDPSFEPTVVFPLSVYFAEAMGCPIEAFPRKQFAIHKDGSGYSFTDHAGRYGDLSLKGALRGRKRLRAKADDAIPA
jgi:methyltransferase family protein